MLQSFASFRSFPSLLVVFTLGKERVLPSSHRNFIGVTLRWNVGSGYLLLPPKLTDKLFIT